MVQEERRRSGGHARPPHQPAPRAYPQRRPEADRTGPDENYSPRKMDPVLPPDYLARAQAVHRASPQMRGLPPGKYLPRRRQDLEHRRDPQKRKIVAQSQRVSLSALLHFLRPHAYSDPATYLYLYEHPYRGPDLARAAGHHRSQADYQQAQCECRTEPAEPFHRTALYDALGGGHILVAGRQDYRFCFQYQRPKQYLAGACRGWVADTTYSERPAPDLARLVARRKMDRIRLRLRRRRAVGYFLRLAQDRAGHQHHKHARDLGREPDLVPGRPLPRLHSETQDLVSLRDRRFRHPDARYQAHHHRDAQRQDEPQSCLVEGREVDRLYPATGQGNGLQYFPGGSRDRQKLASDSTSSRRTT